MVELIAARDAPAQGVPVMPLPGKKYSAALHGKEANGQLVSTELQFKGEVEGEGTEGCKVSRGPQK